MNVHVFVLALLVLSAIVDSTYGRAVDDIDNAIEVNDEEQSSSQQQKESPRSRFGQDWIKLTKTPPTKIIQQLGSTVDIVCEVMGSQIPTIRWVTGHLPLSEIDSLDSNIISESSASAIVRVRAVHVVDHMLTEPQTYTCVGRTGSKTVYASTVVYPQTELKDLVHYRGKQIKLTKPKITYNEKLHLDLVGSNLLLPCKVHSRPRAEIFWMNGDGKLIEQSPRFKILPNGDLLISDIKWEDMGAYKCIARNSLGKDTADTFIYPVLKEDN